MQMLKLNVLAQDGFVEDKSLQAASDEAETLARITKSIHQSDIVDYSFCARRLRNRNRRTIFACDSLRNSFHLCGTIAIRLHKKYRVNTKPRTVSSLNRHRHRAAMKSVARDQKDQDR